MHTNDASSLKRSKILYISEATLEYFIYILVTSSFLATLTKRLGMSDSLTGILSSIISLGCLFQLFSVFMRKRNTKKFVIFMSIINQFLFMLLYIIPLYKGSSDIKIALAFLIIITAYAAYYMAHPKKTNWLMSMIENNKRGSFTADKEIVSLISGILFTFLMGSLIDSFTLKNQFDTAFFLTAAIMLIVTAAHTLTLVFIPEKSSLLPADAAFEKSISSGIKNTLKNKALLKITFLFSLYQIASYITFPFYGTYLIGELDLSLTFISLFTVISSTSRILFSRFFGAYADRKSFTSMLFNCFGILAAAFFCASMANPHTGKIMFTLYYICYGVSQAGINSALINLIFDYVPFSQRADSLAVCQAVSGAAGFLAALAASPFISFIQHKNSLVPKPAVYAQQILSFIAMIFIVYAMIFIKTKLIKKK